MSKYKVSYVDEDKLEEDKDLYITEYEIEASDLSDAQQIVLDEFGLHIEKISE